MTPTELWAQGLSILAMSMNILSYQQKKERRVIACQLFGALLFSVSFFLLGGYAGALLNLVGIVRAVVFLYKERLRATHFGWLLVFSLVYALSYVLTFTVFEKPATLPHLLVELLPVVAMVITTVSFRLNAKMIRRLGLINSPLWLIYNVVTFSIGGILCEAFSLVSIGVGMWRHDRKEKKNETTVA